MRFNCFMVFISSSRPLAFPAKADAALAAIPLLANAAGVRKALIEVGCDAMWTADDAMKNSLDSHPPLM